MEQNNFLLITNECEICPHRLYKHLVDLPPGTQVSHFIRGDGNCGFRAIAHCLWGGEDGVVDPNDDIAHIAVRQAACDTLVQFQHLFHVQWNSTGTPNTANQNFAQYVTAKQTPANSAQDTSSYCDEIMITAASINYHRRINLYKRYFTNQNVMAYQLYEFLPQDVQDDNPINIVHYGNHFEVLVSIPNEVEINLNVQEQQMQEQQVCFRCQIFINTLYLDHFGNIQTFNAIRRHFKQP